MLNLLCVIIEKKNLIYAKCIFVKRNSWRLFVKIPMLYIIIKLEDNFLLIFNPNCQSLEGMLIGIRNLLYLNFVGSETISKSLSD